MATLLDLNCRLKSQNHLTGMSWVCCTQLQFLAETASQAAPPRHLLIFVDEFNKIIKNCMEYHLCQEIVSDPCPGAPKLHKSQWMHQKELQHDIGLKINEIQSKLCSMATVGTNLKSPLVQTIKTILFLTSCLPEQRVGA